MAPGTWRRWARRGVCWILLALALSPVMAARRETLVVRQVTLDLPGPPARVIPADMNQDGRPDLVVVVAYTEIEEIGEDKVENLVQMSRVIPALFDRREVRLYIAEADGTYALAEPPLPLPSSVLHLETGVLAGELVALTDEGLSRMIRRAGEGGPRLVLEPLIEDEPVLARSASFYALLELVHDVDADGTPDVLLPSRRGLTVYRGGANGLIPEPVDRIELPSGWSVASSSFWYPYPEVREVDGDGLPDLVFTRWTDELGPQPRHVFLGEGGGRFRPLRSRPRDCDDALSALRRVETGAEPDPALEELAALGRMGHPAPDVDVDLTGDARAPGMDSWLSGLAALRDLDGDGRAEVAFLREQPRGQGMRKELKDAKRPRQLFRLHRLTGELDVEADPYYELKVVGHAAELDRSAAEGFLPTGLEQFIDLDGDGREDLVTITLDFSLFQVVKIMMTKKIGVGVNFHVYAQREDGTFAEVPNLHLKEKMKFNLNQLELGRYAQFAGDFDGDGRQDFVHFGRGDVITIHRGQPGCRYPKKPDLVIELVEEPQSLDLIRIDDLNGDGRSDLRITRPFPRDDPDLTAPVALDLYLSRGAS